MPAESDAIVERLRAVGLTSSEAKAYLAVIRLGPCRVVEIARQAQLQRTEIYRLMSSLVSMGLVEQSLDVPRQYRPVSVKDAIPQLVKRTSDRLRSITDTSNQLVSRLETLRGEIETLGEPEVRIITGAYNAITNYLELLSSAQSEVWAMFGERQITNAPRSIVREAAAILSSRRLKARAILEVDQRNLKRVMSLTPLIEVRHYQPLHVYLYGFDDRCVSMALLGSDSPPDRARVLFVSHRPCVRMIRSFFDALWNQAMPLAARVAMLQGRRTIREETRVVWGRDQIYMQAATEWKTRARERVFNMTTRYGPIRMLAGAKEYFIEARRRGVKIKLICNVCRQNVFAVKKISAIAEVRHSRIPTSLSLEVLDESEALIHCIQPDTPELRSAADVAILTTNQTFVREIRRILDIIWEHSVPAKNRITQLSRKR